MVNIGIIGCGMAGITHARCFSKIKGVFVSHLYDTSLKSAKKASEIAGSKITSSIEEMLSNKSVNAIVIASPPNTHTELAIKSIKSNKHVLIEKPLAIDLESLELLAKSCCSNSELIILDCAVRHSRLNEKFDYIKYILDSKKIEDVYAISHTALGKNSRPGIEFNQEAKWFLDKKISGGGPLIDWGCYDLSFYFGLLGNEYNVRHVSSYFANGLDKKSSRFIEEHFFVDLLMQDDQNTDNKCHLTLERSSHTHLMPTNIIRIYGKNGSVIINGYPHWESKMVDIYCANGSFETKEFNITADHDYDFFLLAKHFIDCIRGRTSPKLPIQEGIKNMSIILNCIKNAEWDRSQ